MASPPTTRRAKTQQELAAEYKISQRTFRRWLKAAGIKLSGKLVTPKEQDLIYETFGNPWKEGE